MATVSVASALEAARPHVMHPPRDMPVLRWTYRRNGDQLECELSLTTDQSAYELRVFPTRFQHAPASERFDDAISALERQVGFERMLVRDGWHLDRFEHERR